MTDGESPIAGGPSRSAGVGRHRAGLGVVLAIAVAATDRVAASPIALACPDCVVSAPDQSLSIRIDGTVGLGELVGAVAAEIGAALILRRDVGSIGPVRVEDLPAADVLRRLAGRHSLALYYRQGRITRIILVASREQATAASPSVVAHAQRKAGATLPFPLAPAPGARDRRASAVRDIIKLSYRHDAEAAAALGEILARSGDPSLRAAAVGALAGVGGKQAAQLITDRGLADPDPRVRLGAAQALRQVAGPDGDARLRLAARLDLDREVRIGIERLLRDDARRRADRAARAEQTSSAPQARANSDGSTVARPRCRNAATLPSRNRTGASCSAQ